MPKISEIFTEIPDNLRCCDKCKKEWEIPGHGAAINWEKQFGVEWIDFELNCECNLADDEPFPHLRYDGNAIEFFMQLVPSANITHRANITDQHSEVKIWERIGKLIGFRGSDWNWSEKWHKELQKNMGNR